MSFRMFLVVAVVGIAWTCVLGLQRPPPRYSQQYMPDTAFTCRNKIVGSYYADPETDCQLFHVCVSVAGSIQDYKFLCPNDTAFDQESQTCADWYDVDCEAATLYYASDNFDLYRLGSGLESLHYDSVRSDAEPQDNLQRSETSDPVRSAANSLSRASSSNSETTNNNNNNNNNNNHKNNNNNNNNRDILRGSSSINFYNSRNGGKDEDYDNEKTYETISEPKKKMGVRKVARKQHHNTNNNNNNNNNNNVNNVNSGNNYASSSTVAPVVASSPNPTTNNNNNYNGNYNNNHNYNGNYNRQRTSSFPSTTTTIPISSENYNSRNQNYQNNNQNTQKYNFPTSTYKPTTYQQTQTTYQTSNTTPRGPSQNNYNANNQNYNVNNNNYQNNDNQQQTSNSYGQNIGTSPKTTNWNQNYPTTAVTTPRTTSWSQNYPEQRNFDKLYSQIGQSARFSTTTGQPDAILDYTKTGDSTSLSKTYNNIQRSTGFSSTTLPTTIYNDDNDRNTNGGHYNRANLQSSTRQNGGGGVTTKFYPQNYAGNTYIPTTYSPATKKAVINENSGLQSNGRGGDRQNTQTTGNDNGQYTNQQNFQNVKSSTFYDSARTTKKIVNNDGNGRGIDRYNAQATGNDNGQYVNQQNPGTSSKSAQYYESTRATKKATQYNGNYDITNNGKYYETSTGSYEGGRSQTGIGFSPSSINQLAETPRSTTPVPKRTGGPTTYNPNSYNQRQSPTTPRGTTFVSGSAKPFSTTAILTDATTPRPKTSKKNDYDYAYYDNAGGLEYDGLDLEHVVAGSKESSKISRN